MVRGCLSIAPASVKVNMKRAGIRPGLRPGRCPAFIVSSVPEALERTSARHMGEIKASVNAGPVSREGKETSKGN